jgi:hypothetical protein
MAPCVWEARKDCLPVLGNCTSDFSRGYAYCNPQTGWYSARGGGTYASSTIGRYGQACFGGVGGPSGFISFSDENGFIASVSGNAVYCGYGPGTPIPPGVEPFIQSGAPECQAWEETYLSLTNCTNPTPGSCAGIAY